ncbi:MAG: hypothetical protein E7314_00640 [Clostridiales bacterium]|nr:hypothetical protein [Clostridiales bacterium]
MSKKFTNAINTTTEDQETKRICDFFANFTKTYSFLLTEGRHLRFKITPKRSLSDMTITVSHPSDSSISDTLSIKYSWDTVKDILKKHGGKLSVDGPFGDSYVVKFKKDKVAF